MTLENRVERLEEKIKLLETRLETDRQVINELYNLAEIQKKIYEAEIGAGYEC